MIILIENHFSTRKIFSFMTKGFLILITLSLQNVSFADDHTWSGDWDTRWSNGSQRLVLKQTGDRVSNEGSFFKGSFQGVAQGRELNGTWTSNNASGTFVAAMAANGQSFTAHLGNGEWLNGIRAQDSNVFLEYEINQSTPASTLYYFLLIMNSKERGQMEVKLKRHI